MEEGRRMRRDGRRQHLLCTFIFCRPLSSRFPFLLKVHTHRVARVRRPRVQVRGSDLGSELGLEEAGAGLCVLQVLK